MFYLRENRNTSAENMHVVIWICLSACDTNYILDLNWRITE